VFDRKVVDIQAVTNLIDGLWHQSSQRYKWNRQI